MKCELACVPAIAKAESLKELSLIAPATAVTHDDAPGDGTLRAQDVSVLALMVRIHEKQLAAAYRHVMSPPVFDLFEKIVSSEADYHEKLAQLTLDHNETIKRCYWLSGDVYYDGCMSSNTKGFNKDVQTARRQFVQGIGDMECYNDFRNAKVELLREHGKRLVAMDALLVVQALPASWTSKKALEQIATDKLKVANPASSSSSGAQPSAFDLPHMSYKDLLVEAGLITLPVDSVGRKPSSGCSETKLTRAEEAADYDWAHWFMRLGGFQAPIMRLLYWRESWDLGVRGVICGVWGAGGVWGGGRAGRGAPSVYHILLGRTLLWQTLLCQTLL